MQTDRTDPSRLLQRFWAKVEKTGPIPANNPELGECWRWKPSRHWGEYGWIWFAPVVRRPIPAHRAALLIQSYEDTGVFPPIPIGWEKVADHLCQNPACVRPSHLQWIPQFLNVRRGRLAAVNRRKADEATVCKSGHLLSDETKIYYGVNWRCRVCVETSRRNCSKRRAAKLREQRAARKAEQ